METLQFHAGVMDSPDIAIYLNFFLNIGLNIRAPPHLKYERFQPVGNKTDMIIVQPEVLHDHERHL